MDFGDLVCHRVIDTLGGPVENSWTERSEGMLGKIWRGSVALRWSKERVQNGKERVISVRTCMANMALKLQFSEEPIELHFKFKLHGKRANTGGRASPGICRAAEVAGAEDSHEAQRAADHRSCAPTVRWRLGSKAPAPKRMRSPTIVFVVSC